MLSNCDTESWDDEAPECYPAPDIIQEQILENRFSERTIKYDETQFIVYPNPATEGFFVKIPSNQSGLISLTDRLGSVWKEVQVDTGKGVLFVQLDDNMPSGLYFCSVRLSSGKNQTTKVFVTNK
jgi:hypothetical protein